MPPRWREGFRSLTIQASVGDSHPTDWIDLRQAPRKGRRGLERLMRAFSCLASRSERPPPPPQKSPQENATANEVSGSISVLYVCLGTGTEITGYAAAFADQDSLAPGATSPFRATIYRGDACDRSIAGASGWNF